MSKAHFAAIAVCLVGTVANLGCGCPPWDRPSGGGTVVVNVGADAGVFVAEDGGPSALCTAICEIENGTPTSCSIEQLDGGASVRCTYVAALCD